MGSTVDLFSALHERVRQTLVRGRSESPASTQLTARGIADLDTLVQVSVDERTGLPALSIGRRITSQDVADAVDE